MPWLKWLVATIVAFFIYYGASQLMNNIVVGTTASDMVSRTIVPIIVGGVGFIIPLLVFEDR